MNISFLFACFSWPLYVLVQHFAPAGLIPNAFLLGATGFTLLWVLHITAYTARVFNSLWDEYITGPAPEISAAPQAVYRRRDVLWVVGTALGLGATAALWVPTSVFARGHRCGKGYCPDSAPNCCSRARGKCCNGNWACTKTGTCHQTHSAARRQCGSRGIVWACT